MSERPMMGGDGAAGEITLLLKQWQAGDSDALSRVVTELYGDLRRLAQHFMDGERPDHTLQATALVHEAILQMPRSQWPQWQSRRHFLNSAARLMRRLLVDWARSRATTKRGQGYDRVSLQAAEASPFSHDDEERRLGELLALDAALDALALVDERKALVLELRFFGGMSLQEVAEQLEVSVPTVKLDTRLGKAWLLRELQAGAGPGS